MTAAIPYVRFSTPKQEKGDSKDRQLGVCLDYIEKQGWTALPPMMDLGLSAYKGDHLHTGSLGKFTRQVIDGEIPDGTVLVVEQLDRLSRQGHRKALRWLEDMTERGIKIAVVGQNRVYDHASLSANLIETLEVLITGKAAHDYSVRLSERVGSAWKKKIENAQSGELLTRTCPGWLEPVEPGHGDDGTAFRVIPNRADIIKSIYQMSADGLGLHRMVKRLNSDKAENWGRHGMADSKWTMIQVNRLLHSPTPEGDYVPYLNNRKKENGERVVGYYPRIVDAALVAQAREAYVSRQRTGSPNDTARPTFNNLFAGLMTCSKCKGRVVMRRGPLMESGTVRKHPGYLSCENAWQGRGCEGVGMFRYLDLEQSIMRDVLHLSLDDAAFRQPQEVIAKGAAVAEATKALDEARDSQQRLVMLLEKVSDPAPLLARYEALGTSIREGEDALAVLHRELDVARGRVPEAQVLAAARDLSDAIMSMDAEVRIPARLKVAQAMKSAIRDIRFENDNTQLDAKGRLTKKGKSVTVSTQLVHFTYDGNGKLLDKVSFHELYDENDPDMQEVFDRMDGTKLGRESRRIKKAGTTF